MSERKHPVRDKGDLWNFEHWIHEHRAHGDIQTATVEVEHIDYPKENNNLECSFVHFYGNLEGDIEFSWTNNQITVCDDEHCIENLNAR